MKKQPILLANLVMAPDGTILPSLNRHDFRKHTTIDSYEMVHPKGKPEPEIKLGKDYKESNKKWLKWNSELESVVTASRETIVDGGNDYLKRGGKFTEMSIYSNDSFEVIRRFLCRGGRGINGREHLTWTPLFAIDLPWLISLISYLMRNIGGLETHYIEECADLSLEQLRDIEIVSQIRREVRLGIKGQKKPNYGIFFKYYVKELDYRIKKLK